MTGARAMIAIGLLLTLAAALAPLAPAGGAPGASLTVRVPSGVQMAVVALLALSALLLVLLQRRARPNEDVLALARARRRTPAWVALLSLLPFLALLGGAWYIATHRTPGEEVHPIERVFIAISGLMDLLARARKPPTSMAFFDFAVGALVLALALGIFAVLLLVTLAPRIEKWLAGRAGEEAVAPAREAAAPLGDPRAEPDPRRAIVLAWRRFEHALEKAGAARAPWQTPAELMRATLARLTLPPTPVRRLTALYELARFSDRALGAETRAEACESLDAITTSLAETREEVGRAR